MKIAVPTNDGTSISAHFGRSTGFLVFEIEGDKITRRDLRANNGCHGHGSHGEGCDHHAHGHSHGHGAHDHSGIVSTIADCQVVLCGGMGQGAAVALKSHGISPVFVTETGSAEAVVRAYATGKLTPAATGSCHCNHQASN